MYVHVLTINLVADQYTWNVRSVLSQFFIPVRQVLVGDLPCCVKHLSQNKTKPNAVSKFQCVSSLKSSIAKAVVITHLVSQHC